MVATRHWGTGPRIVDQFGRPYQTDQQRMLNDRLRGIRQEMMQAKYDAAQTVLTNENHWANADNLGPHGAASISVRRTLRNRSRYECVENNAFLKGTLLSICNDFVKSGPKLQITDKRISKERQQELELKFAVWTRAIKLRQKLWRMRLAKIVDGESFMRLYLRSKPSTPIKLDFQVLECDRITSQTAIGALSSKSAKGEIDGLRFDKYENPLEYFVLDDHPGGPTVFPSQTSAEGKWVKVDYVIHWFRQDRGWLRGIPETAPSLPLCSILRRYTLAMLRHAETQAEITGFIETEGPPAGNPWTSSDGQTLNQDDPFQTFPLTVGMLMNLPWGYKFKQHDAVPLGAQYDEFVGSILREITRPILVPFNVASGTSKDSNMASAVVDSDIYKEGQAEARTHCEEEVLDKVLALWWYEAIRTPGYIGDSMLVSDQFLRKVPPLHVWRWDRIGLDHTDPSRVAKYLTELLNTHILTDRQIQETYFNRSVEDWREEVQEDKGFRDSLAPEPEEGQGESSQEPQEQED